MGPGHVENLANLACRSALANRTVSHICIPIDEGDRYKRNVPGHTAGAEAFVVPRTVPPRGHLERAAELLRGKRQVAILAGAGPGRSWRRWPSGSAR
jgi:pyruvate dehydrogenase (quinone)